MIDINSLRVRYEPHAFYRNHYLCFSTFRTKNIHIYVVCCCQRTIAMIDISFRTRITSRTHCICCCQRTLATIYISFRASITSGTRFIENISGVFSHLERRMYTYILSFSHKLCPLQATITNRTRLYSKNVYC